MAISKDKRRRLELEKAGKLNPEVRRGGWGDIKPIEKKTPTLIEKLSKNEKKYKNRWNSLDNNERPSIFI